MTEREQPTVGELIAKYDAALAAERAHADEMAKALNGALGCRAADICTCGYSADGGYSCPVRIAQEVLERHAARRKGDSHE